MTLDTPEQFAMMACALEDMHDVTIQGQQADNPPELQLGLLACLKLGLLALGERADAMGVAIHAR
ncbi:MAG: hypothetical protein JWO15_2674 [Sphingomonadales bacterium]|nr:hypothetical protein [Sphingomonadales bacterium]